MTQENNQTMGRLQVFFVAAAIFLCITTFSGGSTGFSSQCMNGQCIVVASTAPLSILISVIMGVFIIFRNGVTS